MTTEFVLDDFGQRLRSELKASLAARDEYPFIGKSRMIYQLDRQFTSTTALLAYNFFVDFYELSGTASYPVTVRNGCVRIESLPDRTTDHYGADLREKFFRDPEYHQFCRAYGIRNLVFHAFPRLIERTNYNIELYFGDDGTPRTR